MRLKLPWQRDKGVSKPEPKPLATLLAGIPDDPQEEDTSRGTLILESTHVETVELGDLAKLPPFRPVAITLVRLFDREDVKIEEIATLVQSDPSMASELLAVVNSPLFALQRQVTSPLHAISLLGVERTKSLAATLAMRSLMQGAPRTPVVRRFWVHSIATATIARHFAGVYRAEPELSHVAALMHDLGRTGLLAAYPEEYTRLALAAHENAEEILAAEEAAFGMDHCHAGALLAKAWNLPRSLLEVAAHHHGLHSGKPGTALVQLACRLADDFMYQSIHRRDVQKPEETIRQVAPHGLRATLLKELESVSAAIDSAIKGLDF